MSSPASGRVTPGRSQPSTPAFQPGLGRYLRYRDESVAVAVAESVWRDLLVQLANFAGTERDFRTLLYTVAMRQLAEPRGARPRPRLSDHWVLPANSVDQAVALLGNTVAPEQGLVVVLRVVGDLDVEETAHVLRTTSGAIPPRPVPGRWSPWSTRSPTAVAPRPAMRRSHPS